MGDLRDYSPAGSDDPADLGHDLPPELADEFRVIQSITEVALPQLVPQDLLQVLVERVRQAFNADTAAVLLLDEAAGQLVATAASGLEEEVRQGVRIALGKGFAGRIAGEARPVVLDTVNSTNVVNPLLIDKGLRSLMGAPLISGGRVLGVLHVGTLTPRKFSEPELNLLQLAADRAALAVQALNASLDRAAALALQRSLLPSALPVVPGLQMAARFVPGSGSIGGDWYDVFLLPSGQVCAVIGDVAGSGLKAAVIMGRLRSALRAYALETNDPADVLERLDRKMRHFEPDAMATVLCAVFGQGLDQVTISSAGHLPPILAVPGEAGAVAAVAADPLIGAPEHWARRVTTLDLPDGAMLCLYTDGLVERRDQPIDDGIARLAKSITTADPDACCTAAMTAMADLRPLGDDVALLIFRRDSDAPRTRADAPAVAAPTDLRSMRVRWHGEHAIVIMPEEIDVTNAPGILNLLVSVAAAAPRVVTADLTMTTFCDSAGISTLARAQRAVADNAGELRLALGGSPVRRILQLTGIDQVIPIFGGVEESLAVPGQ